MGIKIKPLYITLCSYALGFCIGSADYEIFFFGIYLIKWCVGFRVNYENKKGSRKYISDKDRVLNIGLIFGKDLLDA